MRRGEIQKIRRKDINFSNSVFAITDQENGETSYLPMNRVCREVLSKYWDLADNAQPFAHDFSSTFDRIVKKLDIPNFHFHDLRHTFASSLVMNAIDLNTVRELLRHKSLAMTLRYAHLAPGFKQTAVERFNTHWTPEENPAGLKGPAARRNPLQPRKKERVDLRRVELLASAMRKPNDPNSQPAENIATEPEYYI